MPRCHSRKHPSTCRSATICGDGGTGRASRTGIFDLAPTMLHLIGVSPPLGMTDRILHELLDGGETVPAPVSESCTARIGERTSHLSWSRIGASIYLDDARID